MRKPFRTFLISQGCFCLGLTDMAAGLLRCGGCLHFPTYLGLTSLTPAIPAPVNRISLSSFSAMPVCLRGQARRVSVRTECPSPLDLFFFLLFSLLFLLAALGLSCCMWDLQHGVRNLVPRPRNEAGPPALGADLAPGPPGQPAPAQILSRAPRVHLLLDWVTFPASSDGSTAPPSW